MERPGLPQCTKLARLNRSLAALNPFRLAPKSICPEEGAASDKRRSKVQEGNGDHFEPPLRWVLRKASRTALRS